MNDMDMKDHTIKTIIWKAEKKPKRRPSIFLAAERLQARLENKKKEKEPVAGIGKDGKSGRPGEISEKPISPVTIKKPPSVEKAGESNISRSVPENRTKESAGKERAAFAESDLQAGGLKESRVVLKKAPAKSEMPPEMNGTDDRCDNLTEGPENATEITNGRKSVREGWVSPEYSKSKAVKIDYRKAARNRCVGFFRDLPYVEHYKMLRTQIQQRCGEKGWKTIMVTSVNSEEGKTVTAINLSVVLAREFEQTVLLVDADLQKQHIHKYMGYDASHSLVDYLERDMSLSDVIVWPGIEKLTVISGENTVRDSTEILGSPKMSSLVAEMKARYEKRYIVFDVPPVIGHADAMTFAPLMDGILLVVKPGRTDLKDVVKTMELLPKEKIIGFAMNRYE